NEAELLASAEKRIGLSPLRKASRKILDAHELADTQIEDVFDIGDTKGFFFVGSEREVRDLESDGNVATIEKDVMVGFSLDPNIKSSLIPTDHGPGTQQAEYGVSRVGGSTDLSNSNVWAFVIDSGVDLDHPDLNIKEAHSKSFIKRKNSDDEYGHGTHVAGIIGAKDNGIGVVGVAAGVPIVSLRVLDQKGKGFKSSMLKAIDHIKTICIPGDVVNISLGTGKSQMIHDAISSLVSTYGVRVVVAAGNKGMSTKNITPAAMEESGVYIVGAIDQQDNVPDWSNFGQSVYYLAPGVDIYSTYHNGMYASISGTSMAAPHVAGILLATGGTLNEDGFKIMQDGRAAQIATKN
ncbi:MAG: S8 family serine peptidase, partial [Bacteroidota bacterium]